MRSCGGFTDDSRLSPSARQAIGDESNEVYVSAVSAWEITIKTRIGKLKGVPHLLKKYNELIFADGFSHLSITHLHCLRAGSFDWAHKDPFDRMLASQSQLEKLRLVSLDPVFYSFKVPLFW